MAIDEISVQTMYSGQGMCTVIVAYEASAVSKLMLVDFGAEKDAGTAREHTLAALKTLIESHGVLDALVVSHSDKDHWNLLSELLDQLDAKIKITVAAFGTGNWVGAAQTFRAKVEKRKANDKTIKLLDSSYSDISPDTPKIIEEWDVGWDGVTFYILCASVNFFLDHDGDVVAVDETNTQSVVLMCSFADQNVFLPGDATGSTLQFLNNRMDGHAYHGTGFMMTAPHHGAIATLDYSLGGLETFIDATEPKCALASAQLRGGYNHPNICVMSTMAKYAGQNAFKGGPHPTVANFPGTDLCNANSIFKILNALPKVVARSGYFWYGIKTDYNIFSTLLSGSEAANWYFGIKADGTTSVTQDPVKFDIAEALYRLGPLAEDEFFVGRSSEAAVRATADVQAGTPPRKPRKIIQQGVWKRNPPA
ncbi:ComEC/Rec2 family competence protein [Massilia antarctica]|uniref:ComEC/Rec2 family competence protein n=1 Tax=Massilia antarctica TaxID=2765360 RepID=UPI00226D7AAE|nr:hypothetical protein [Massilia sp. H27-R4]MCY0916311.1 hypothetical protein [Massilia sp. H27-R4]